MKKFFCCVLLGALGILPLSGCQTPPTHQQLGTVIGSGTGALVGSQFGGGTGQLVATGVGAVLGGVIGSEVGSYMDKTDNLSMQQALNHSTVGQPIEWNSPDHQQQYRIVPTRAFIYEQQPCRDYTVIITEPDRSRRIVQGTACRSPNGEWHPVQLTGQRNPHTYLPPGY
jgi:surface antigen